MPFASHFTLHSHGDMEGQEAGAKVDSAKPRPRKDTVNVSVVGPDNTTLKFKIKRSATLEKLMLAFCENRGHQADGIRFLYDGARVRPEDTADDLELEDGDTIDAMLAQIGGLPMPLTPYHQM